VILQIWEYYRWLTGGLWGYYWQWVKGGKCEVKFYWDFCCRVLFTVECHLLDCDITYYLEVIVGWYIASWDDLLLGDWEGFCGEEWWMIENSSEKYDYWVPSVAIWVRKLILFFYRNYYDQYYCKMIFGMKVEMMEHSQVFVKSLVPNFCRINFYGEHKN